MIIGQFIFKFEYERIQNRARPTEIMVHMILIIERSEILIKPFIIAILSINVLIIGFFIYIVLDETVSAWVLKRILHATKFVDYNQMRTLVQVRRIRMRSLKSKSLRPNDVSTKFCTRNLICIQRCF